MFGVRDPIARGPHPRRCVVYKFFYVQAVIPAMSANPLGIYPHVYVSTWSVIRNLTFSDIYKILDNVALYVLMSVLAP